MTNKLDLVGHEKAELELLRQEKATIYTILGYVLLAAGKTVRVPRQLMEDVKPQDIVVQKVDDSVIYAAEVVNDKDR